MKCLSGLLKDTSLILPSTFNQLTQGLILRNTNPGKPSIISQDYFMDLILYPRSVLFVPYHSITMLVRIVTAYLTICLSHWYVSSLRTTPVFFHMFISSTDHST